MSGWRASLILGAALAAGAAIGIPPVARAQTFEPPPFRALDWMQTDVEQGELDSLARQRADALADPAAQRSAADRALAATGLDREMDRVRLGGDLMRAEREREIVRRAADLPNRRIAAASVLRVRNPPEAGLPAPPPGQFYARLEGRIVVVDETSELVVAVLPDPPIAPTEAPLARRPEPEPARPWSPRGGIW